MKKFRFRLQKVLDVKEIELRQKQKALAEVQELKQKQIQKIMEQEQKANRFLSELSTKEKGSARELRLYQNYLHQLWQALEDEKKNLQRIDEQENEAIQRLLKTERERKMLLNLHDRAFNRFIAEVQQQEQKTLDEIAILTASHNATGD